LQHRRISTTVAADRVVTALAEQVTRPEPDDRHER
jgi:hypothetical protein